MAKDINIHTKVTGTQQAKQQLDSVGDSAQKVGTSTEQMGTKASRASGKVSTALQKLAGTMGFMAIVMAVATAAAKIAKFFDDLKTRCDEAVRNVQGIRKEFADLFEAMDAFDERSRQQVMKETAALLKETSVSKEIGLPIINAYTRQFRGMVESGQLTEEQYGKGLREMLGYGERHGGAATTELITLMAGWGMTTPEQQGAFRRQIAAGAAASGLTDAELIEALGRGMPTVKAMGWTPAQAVETVATLAAGEVGRQKTGLPATTLQALLAPQTSNIAKYGISEEIAQDPQQLLMQLQLMREKMDQQAFTKMLTDIYGTTAAAGVSKLLTAPRKGISKTLEQAAGAEGAKLEQEEERRSRETQERRDARAKAAAMEEDLDVKITEQYEEDIREIGEAKRRTFRRRRPIRQWIREHYIPKWPVPEEQQKEEAAFRAWYENLTSEEKKAIPYFGGYRGYWERMTPQQRYEILTRTKPEVIRSEQEQVTGPTTAAEVIQGEQEQVTGPTTAAAVHHHTHYHHDTIYTPVVGDRQTGPRFSQD